MNEMTAKILPHCYTMVYHHITKAEELGLPLLEMPPHMVMIQNEGDILHFKDIHIISHDDQNSLGLYLLTLLDKRPKDYVGFVYWCIMEVPSGEDRVFVMVFGDGESEPLSFTAPLSFKSEEYEFLEIDKVPFLDVDYNQTFVEV